jgi:prepilin-type N-terminal cleavage/methylation domain-containing protein
MNQKGFTLTESLLALAVLGIAMVGILPTFLTYMDSNTLSEERTQAVGAAQRVMETLRHLEPKNLPSTGSDPVEIVEMGSREFEVQRHFCVDDTYCSSDSRQVVVEVSYGGSTIYTLETVLTALR